MARCPWSPWIATGVARIPRDVAAVESKPRLLPWLVCSYGALRHHLRSV
jgi:hypothetical protein